jgi:hypothetical protein
VKFCATTIVSANYLAYAKVLADSVRRHFEAAAFVVLLVDRRSAAVEQRAQQLGLDFIWAEDLGLADLERIAYQFDILELNTALKPTLLKRLLSRGHEAVIYWDPDIRLFAAPEPIVTALQQASIVVTPHALAPLMDGRRPSDIDLMRHGSFNLGFIAVRGDANGRALLDWWEDRCLMHGFCDPVEGTFVDQRWLDLAPSYFDGVHILKHRGCNVAYWNLHERPLGDAGGFIIAGSDPLVFFHFSGVDPRDGARLSKYQNRHGVGGADKVLDNLVAGYCKAVMGAGHAELVVTPYSFGMLDSGKPISALMRRALVCAQPAPVRPFEAAGEFQRGLRAAGLWPAENQAVTSPEAKINAFSFDPTDRRVRIVNQALRVAFRLLGTGRAQLLMKYLVFLSRGSNLAAVLTGRPFMLDHRSRVASGGSIAAPAASAAPGDAADSQ